MNNVLSIILILALSLAACASIKPPRKSIQALSDIHADGKIHEFCTAWATLYKDRVVWLSAAHCVEFNEDQTANFDFPYVIAGTSAKLLAVDFEKDLAMFGGPYAPPLKVAFTGATIGELVYTISYFWKGGFYSEGVASWPDEDGRQRFSVVGGPGSSGAPVMIKGNIVVGVIQSGPCQTPCPAAAGVSMKDIRAFLEL